MSKDRLYKALYVLFYDQDITDGEDVSDNEEENIENTIELLIKLNKDVCPFKKYSCDEHCNAYTDECKKNSCINCNRDAIDVWKEFINI